MIQVCQLASSSGRVSPKSKELHKMIRCRAASATTRLGGEPHKPQIRSDKAEVRMHTPLARDYVVATGICVPLESRAACSVWRHSSSLVMFFLPWSMSACPLSNADGCRAHVLCCSYPASSLLCAGRPATARDQIRSGLVPLLGHCRARRRRAPTRVRAAPFDQCMRKTVQQQQQQSGGRPKQRHTKAITPDFLPLALQRTVNTQTRPTAALSPNAIGCCRPSSTHTQQNGGGERTVLMVSQPENRLALPVLAAVC